MSRSTSGLGFTMATDESRRPIARFHCTECDAKADVVVVGTLNPELIAKNVCRKGWRAWPYKQSKTYCPKCLGPSAANNPNSELEKVKPMSSSVISLKDPTPDQRFAIRGHLDKSFDDSKGMFLDDMSDQRIAELVGVPRACVERIREMAYGSIKVDPVIAGLRAELVGLRSEMDAMQTGLDNLKKKGMDMGSRLEKAMVGRAA